MASSVTASAPAVPERRPAALLPAGPARLIGFSLLGALGALEWQRMVTDLSAALALLWVVVGVLAGGLVILADRLGPRARHVAAFAVAALALPAAWMAAGLDLGLFRHSRWPELGDGIARGAEAVSQVRLPYEGADPWPAWTLQALGSLLCVLAGLLSVWPRGRPGEAGGYPFLALSALLVLVAVPVVSLGGTQPVALGIALAALTVLFLLLERLPLRPGVGVAALLGLALAGALPLGAFADKEEPWFDYKAFAETLGPEDPVRFRWEHGDYGPISWDRTGAEVLRIGADEPSYWKVETLSGFDGVGWRVARARFSSGGRQVPRNARDRRDYTERLNVRVRRFRGEQVVGAGTILDIRAATRTIVPGDREGSWIARSDLRAGDSYTAEVYVPRPKPQELAAAPAVLPGTHDDDLELRIPITEGGPGIPTSPSGYYPSSAEVDFEGYDVFGARGRADYEELDAVGDADAALRSSPYARTWQLAQRLRRRTDSPYAYVLAVNRFLQRGFTYDERPAPPALGQAPLDAFLFDTKAGYCQHYSGAMAMLLRMGGIPARVATGFSPGGYSERRNAWIVRDTDAHSWVEAWFEGIGWVSFDPTPAATPARSQIAAIAEAADPEENAAGDEEDDDTSDGGAGGDSGGSDVRQDLLRDGAGDDAAGAGGGDGLPTWLAAPLGVLGTGALMLAALALRLRRRGDALDAERSIAELQRALRRTGRGVKVGTTLSQLESRLGLSGDAAAYVRALRAGRYAPGAPSPSAAQRRALRRELAAGTGWLGRLRVLWALPPRLFAR